MKGRVKVKGCMEGRKSGLHSHLTASYIILGDALVPEDRRPYVLNSVAYSPGWWSDFVLEIRQMTVIIFRASLHH